MGLDITITQIKNKCKCCGRAEIENDYDFRKVNFLVGFWESYYDDEMENCVIYNIDRLFIETLLETCTEVLADHSKAEDLLPTREGFFFGNYEYDDEYFGDVEHVLDTCKKLLDDLAIDPTIEHDISIWY